MKADVLAELKRQEELDLEREKNSFLLTAVTELTRRALDAETERDALGERLAEAEAKLAILPTRKVF